MKSANSEVRKVAILGGARIPFARSGTNYHDQSNQDLLTASLKALVRKFNLEGKRLDSALLHRWSPWAERCSFDLLVAVQERESSL